MYKVNTNIIEEYRIRGLQEKIDRWAAENIPDGIPVYANYDDELDEKQAIKFLDEKKPVWALEDWLFDECMWDSYYDELRDDTWFDCQRDIGLDDDDDAYDDLKDYFIEEYGQFDVSDVVDKLMGTSFHCDIFMKMEYSDVIKWLAKTQGYTIDDVDRVLDDDDRPHSDSSFLCSLWGEVVNNNGNSQLTILKEFTFKQLVDIKNGNYKGIEVGKDTFMGMFDSSDGSGSIFDISLEKPFMLTKDDDFYVCLDSEYHYNVEETYGMCGSAWTDGELVKPKKGEDK